MPYNFNSNLHTYGNRPTHAHIAHQPAWFGILRFIQFLFALLTLILSAYALHSLGKYDGFGLNIFTSILTFIFLAYIFVTAFKFHQAYNMWAVLGFEIALVIFWLVTFALLADAAVTLKDWDDYWQGRRVEGYNGTDATAAVNCTKAAAVFAAFTWVSFVVTLVFYSLTLHKHRKAGHPFMAGGVGSAPGGGSTKMETVQPATADQTYPPATHQPAYNPNTQPAYNPNAQTAV